MNRCWVAVLLIAGCGGDSLTKEEREALQGLVEARQMAKEAHSELADTNDMKEAVLAWTESIDAMQPGEMRSALTISSGLIYSEYLDRRTRDGDAVATKWHYDQVVGVKPEAIVAKWSWEETKKQ